MAEINLTPTASYLDIDRPVNGSGAHGSSATSGALTARSWGSAKECVAAALLVHGLGAHSGWFEALGRRLKVRRVFSLAYDQAGFGRRRNEPFTTQRQWFDDLTTAFQHLRKTVGDKPIFIMGNSMGALVSLKVVADQTIVPPPAGLVMFSPGFDGNPALFKLQYKVSAIVSAFVAPEKEVLLPYTVDMITRSENVRTWLQNDPDRRFSPTGRMLLELLKLSMAAPKIRSVPCPTLMFRSGKDNIVDGKVSQRIFGKLDSPGKEEILFKDAWHDLMFDPCLDDVCDDLLGWMNGVTNGVPGTRT